MTSSELISADGTPAASADGAGQETSVQWLGWEALHLARFRGWDAERIGGVLDICPTEVRAAMRMTLLDFVR